MTIKKNVVTDTRGIIGQYTNGQGKTVNPTNGQRIGLLDTDIIPFVESLNPDFVVAALSHQYWKDSKYGNIDKTLKEFAEAGYINNNHYNSVNGAGNKDAETPFTHELSNQTSDRQEWQYLQLRFSDQQQTATIVDLLLTDVSKMKLPELQRHVADILESIYPENERAVVQTMRDKEKKDMEKFLSLTSAGYENIRQVKGGGWSALVSPAPAATIRDTLALAGFRLTGNVQFDAESGKLAILFNELEKTVDEPLA